LITLEFCVLINTNDSGNRSANYIFDALALWIQQKHIEKMDHDNSSVNEQNDEKSENKKYAEFEINITVKNNK